jgi:hypothetical protein
MAMAAESFFARWSKQKTELPPVAPDTAAEPVAVDQPEPALPPPTIEDVATLTPQSDYTRFIGKGVDENIQRAALKKLFTDPHFNIMDGLDIYIGDYNKFDPIPPEMLALLNHAKGLLDPLSQFENPLMRLMEEATSPEAEPAPAEEPAAAKNTADIVSASVESPSRESVESDTNPPLPHDAAPTQTLTKSDDDHKI